MRGLAGSLTCLNTTLLLPAELDLAKLAFADRIAENVFAKLGVLFSLGMVVATSPTAPRLLAVVGRGDNRRCGSIVVVMATHLMRLGHGEALPLALNVHFGL